MIVIMKTLPKKYFLKISKVVIFIKILGGQGKGGRERGQGYNSCYRRITKNSDYYKFEEIENWMEEKYL